MKYKICINHRLNEYRVIFPLKKTYQCNKKFENRIIKNCIRKKKCYCSDFQIVCFRIQLRNVLCTIAKQFFNDRRGHENLI